MDKIRSVYENYDKLLQSSTARSLPNVWVIGPPKSGSTLLSQIISDIMGISINDVMYTVPFDYRFDPLKYLEYRKIEKNIFHFHAHWDLYLHKSIETENTRPIVLQRDISEILISLGNHQVSRGTPIGNMLKSSDRSTALSMVISQWLVWLEKYNRSWFSGGGMQLRTAGSALRPIFVHFNNLNTLERCISSLQMILSELNIEKPTMDIEKACRSVFSDPVKSNKTQKYYFTAADLAPEHFDHINMIRSWVHSR